MFDIINHLCVLSLIAVFYYSALALNEEVRSGFEWYIPACAAIVTLVWAESLVWPVWYLFIK